MYQGVTSETEKFEIFRSNARSNKRKSHKRFKGLGGGLYRHKSGSLVSKNRRKARRLARYKVTKEKLKELPEFQKGL